MKILDICTYSHEVTGEHERDILPIYYTMIHSLIISSCCIHTCIFYSREYVLVCFVAKGYRLVCILRAARIVCIRAVL